MTNRLQSETCGSKYPPPASSPCPSSYFLLCFLPAIFRDLRLPGKDISSPEVFPFGTPYRDLYDTLKRKDEAFFLKNNLLRLAARNATIKAAPQRFQDIEGPDMVDFDVVLCFEARVFYSVVEGTYSSQPVRGSVTICMFSVVHT